MAVVFRRREDAPSSSNKYYLKYDSAFDGYDKCIMIDSSTGSCLPNCTGYAYGRFMECQNNVTTCNLSTGDAGNWYYKNDGYQRGQDPKLGAVICWSDSEGAGHVAIVEKIESNGDILTSNSAYGGSYFYLKTLSPSNNYYMGSTYSFQGFIYNPTEFIDPDNPNAYDKKNKFKWAIYTNKIRKRHLTQYK